MLHNAETTLRTLRTELSETSAADAVLRGELRAAVQAATAATQEVLAARELVEARESVVAQVELDLRRLERSATAIDQLSPSTSWSARAARNASKRGLSRKITAPSASKLIPPRRMWTRQPSGKRAARWSSSCRTRVS